MNFANWTIDGDVQGNPLNLNCTVRQDATAKLAGKCEVKGMETEIEGAVKDAEFTFAFTVSGYTLTYTGRIKDDAMTGGVEVAGATGSFTGKRKKPRGREWK